MKKTLSLMLGLGVITCFSACDENSDAVQTVREAVNESAPVQYVDTVLAQARPTQNTSLKCLNYLKQVGLALHMYSMDNSDVFPAELSELSGLVDISLTRCPADNTTYQYSGSGLNLLTCNNPGSEVVVTCPVHNHKLMADGHAERGN